MNSEDPHDVVRLAAAANPFQAHIWQQALEQEGISSQVLGDYLDAGIGVLLGIQHFVPWLHNVRQNPLEGLLASPRDAWLFGLVVLSAALWLLADVHAPMNSPCSAVPATWVTPATLSGAKGFATCGSRSVSGTG